ncbi:MAG: TRAP transporter small permease [Bacteroidota bacterium]
MGANSIIGLTRGISYLLKLGTIVSSLGFMGAVLIQIAARFLLSSAPSWTEEASRFFFLYAMSFAAGLAFRGNYYVQLDLFYNRMSAKARRVVDLCVYVAIILLFLALGIYAIPFITQGIPEHSPSLGVSMSVAFSSMVLMAVAMMFFAVLRLLGALKRKP